MKLVKSALRNRLYIETLDSLMTVSLLGTEFSLVPAAVQELVKEAYAEWCLLCQRDPRKARFGNKNASKSCSKMETGGKTEVPLEHTCSSIGEGSTFDEDADNEEALEAGADGACAAAWCLMADSGSIGGDQADDTDAPDVDEYAAIEPFNAPGWSVEPQPASHTGLKHKKIAHKFLTGEWLVGSYVKRCGRGVHKGEHEVMFRSTNNRPETWYMKLNLSEYGASNVWCVVKIKK